MKNKLLFILLLAGSFTCRAQSWSDSIKGKKYQYENWIGGGFASGADGRCYALPPDIRIYHTLIIGSDMAVTKIADSIGNPLLFGSCDPLYFGKGQIEGDTLIVTYDKKPVCPNFLANDDYEAMDPPVIEKYYFRMIDNRLYSIVLRDDDGDDEEEYQLAP